MPQRPCEEKGGRASGRLVVAALSRTPLPPVRFVAVAHRLLGEASAASHAGRAASQFSYRLGKNGEALLVAWGPAAEALKEKGLPRFEAPVRPPDSGDRRRVLARVRHLTPTVLKRLGGPRLACFDPEGYARAVAGALRAAGLEVSPEEALREIEPARVRVAERPWDLGCGTAKGFVGEVVLRMPRPWAEGLRAMQLAGLGGKRAWGMGNVEVEVVL